MTILQHLTLNTRRKIHFFLLMYALFHNSPNNPLYMFETLSNLYTRLVRPYTHGKHNYKQQWHENNACVFLEFIVSNLIVEVPTNRPSLSLIFSTTMNFLYSFSTTIFNLILSDPSHQSCIVGIIIKNLKTTKTYRSEKL